MTLVLTVLVCSCCGLVAANKPSQASAPPSIAREAYFTFGLSRVYGKLKFTQAHCAFRRYFLHEKPEVSASRWEHVQNCVGADLYSLCATLGGAYVKVGQFFATRPDLVPEQWCRHLGTLCDAVEPMDGTAAYEIAAQELHVAAGGQQVLSEWCKQPLGSASVAQVHAARLMPTRKPSRWQRMLRRGPQGRMVAVKVRRPEAATYFSRDLTAVQKAAGLVQRFELSFDLLSCVKELRDRVNLELDLRIEYDNLVRGGGALRQATEGRIAAPVPILGTRQCLITELLDAVPLSALARQMQPAINTAGEQQQRPGAALRSGIGSTLTRRLLGQVVSDLYHVYGRMVLCSPIFHADPHPGNLLLPRAQKRAIFLSTARDVIPPPFRWVLPYAPPRLYLIDWGQCGGPTPAWRRRQLAHLFIELADAGDVDFGQEPARAARVASALRDLGVVKGGGPDDEVEADMARGMFDSAGDIDLGENNNLDKGGIETLPKDLFLVLRVTQMLRGLGDAAEKAGAHPSGSLATTWRPHARHTLATTRVDSPSNRGSPS